MNDITIVTAFFDIGRGEWTPENGLPHYLHRTTETYLERFAYMASLENQMVIFTSEDLAPRIEEIRTGKPTQIIVMDFKSSFVELKSEVSRIQNSEDYKKMINPTQIKNPEYWNSDYVVVNLLKSTFVHRAIKMNLVDTDLIAWLDFGYCRDVNTLNGKQKWSYDFDREKIHFFNIKEFKEETYIVDVISNNDVHITGPCIVASKDLWPKLELLVEHAVKELIQYNLIDDDQTLLLMAYLFNPELFELHKVSDNDWFVVFRDYSE